MDKALSKKIYNGADYRSLTKAEQTAFRNIVAELDERQLLRATDAPIIASYARQSVLARVASKEVQERGVTIAQEDKYHGTIYKTNPSWIALQQAEKAMREAALTLGLTPTGRKRVRDVEGAPRTESDKWDEVDD